MTNHQVHHLLKKLHSLVIVYLMASGSLLLANTDKRYPNIVVILVDDMGYGDIGSYNSNSKIPTPHLDQLAKEGLKFTDAHASGPLCHVSRYGLITGRYPFRGQPHLWRKQPTIKADRPTIGSLLQGRGYHTSMVGKWHLGFKEEGYDKPLTGGPADRGFHDYFGIRASTDIPPYFYIRDRKAVEPPSLKIKAKSTPGWTPIQGEFWRAGGIAPNLKLVEVLPRFTQEAIKVIETHGEKRKEKPLFLYLAYPAPHTPWLPTKEFKGKSKADLYGDFMMMVDANIGQVLEALKKQGMEKETLVIFSSDNGPVWYEQDVKRFDHDSSGGLRGMKADAWEAGHRMPFIVKWPGKVKAGTSSDQLISFVDLFSTFRAIVGNPSIKNAPKDSQSFLPELLGTTRKETKSRNSLVVKSGRSHYSVRKGNWKLITGLGSGGFSKPSRIQPKPGGPKGQLYNLKEDLGETNNLYLKHPEIVKSLEAELERILGMDA